MEQAACASLLAKSPEGLDTLIGEMGMKLSGGEKQRLSIARALIRQPAPADLRRGDLGARLADRGADHRDVRGLSSRHSQITILIAHRLSTVMHADTIFVLEKGRIVESGVHAALLAGNGLYAGDVAPADRRAPEDADAGDASLARKSRSRVLE
jgi:ATP-binding cassette subfamily B protein